MQPQQFIDLLQSSLALQYFFVAYLSSITILVLMLSVGKKDVEAVYYRSGGRYNYGYQVLDILIAGLLWPVTIAIALVYLGFKSYR